jgi:spore coat protein U-like protein
MLASKEEDVMGHFRKAIISTSILLLLAMPVATPAAAATFDGEWNVQIASTNTACGSGATVSIGINNGQVASTNELMKASGRVADAGNISVTLTSGMKRAVGFGRLTGTSGSGTWRNALCTGTWTAQRI